MNTKNIILLALVFPLQFAFAQIGNVGINTNNPQEKLHVKGTMRLESSTSITPGSYLFSDANGNATWQFKTLSNKNYHPTYGTTPYELLNFNAPPVLPPGYVGQNTLSEIKYTGTYIDLPAGKWLVMFNNVANIQYTVDRTVANPVWTDLPADKSVWVRSTLSDDTIEYVKGTDMNNKPTGLPRPISADIQGAANKVSNIVSGPSPTALIIGELFVNNTSGAVKRYYVKVNTEIYNMAGANKEAVKLINFGITPTIVPETKFIAYPIQ